MTRPNFIPRTRIGVGGVRLFDIPGVIYPKEMLHAPAGTIKKTGKAYNVPPAWGITSKQAAAILRSSISATRTVLHKARVKFRIVKDSQSRRIYWHKDQVEQLAAKRAPETSKAPAGTISTQEAISLLGVSRTSLQRYYQKGKLPGIIVRFVNPRIGPRHRTYFNRAAVQQLAKRMERRRRIQAEVAARMETTEP